ncbi:MAG: DUF255 domain-containing protein [Campylobacterales bacterium]|nr:DUF255 domain-containing protein [Campylobacterales bacterium]
MKRYVFLFLVSLMFLFSEELHWNATLDDAISKAQIEDKIIMVFVESEYCRWCKKMKNRTFVNPKVSQQLARIEIVKVMRDDYETLQSFPYIKGVPTMFFITPNKKIIGQIVGYVNATDFLSYFTEAQAKVKKLKEEE